MVVFSRNYLFNKSDVPAKENATIPLWHYIKTINVYYLHGCESHKYLHIHKKLTVN